VRFGKIAPSRDGPLLMLTHVSEVRVVWSQRCPNPKGAWPQRTQVSADPYISLYRLIYGDQIGHSNPIDSRAPMTLNNTNSFSRDPLFTPVVVDLE